MSISADFRELGKLKAPEKSSFSQTCNLLSQYLKEKRSFGDLSFAAPTLNRDSDIYIEKSPAAMDLFPQHVGFGDDSVSKEEVTKAVPSEIKKQMTIIYGGKVVVFDDISEEKVKEVMILATSSSLKNSSSFCSNLVDLNAPHVSGLPIARKASLHRFLEKRKDRIIARAPYQLNMSARAANKPEEKKTWLAFL